MSIALPLLLARKQNRAPTIAQRLVVLVAAAVIPVLGFSAFMMVRYADAARAGYEAQMLATARALSIAIDREIAGQESELITLRDSSELAAGDWSEFQQRCQAVVGSSGRVLALFDPSGREIVSSLSPLGTVRYTAAPDVMRRVIQTGAPVISDLIPGETHDRDGVAMGVPVLRDGRVAYVLVMGFGPRRISDILVEQRLAAGWTATVFDHNGVILARSRDMGKFEGRGHRSGTSPKSEAVEEGIKDIVTLDGLPAKAAFVRSAESGWAVVLAVERQVQDGPLRRSLFMIGAGGIALLAAVLVTAYLYSRRIAGPMTSLANMAGALGRGEIPPHESLMIKEADVVAEEIRDAATLLRRRNSEREALLTSLENRVEARTQELAESEAKYRLLADSISDMVVRTDPQNIVTYVSPSSMALIGYPPEELLGNIGNRFVHPEDFAELASTVRRPEPRDAIHNYRMLRKDGSYVWVEGSFRHLTDPSTGQYLGHVATIRDMTSHHEAEERAHLAAIRAQAASHAKSEFLASMSHELRTPLNAVIGFADFLLYDKRQSLSESQRESVGYILRGGKQLLELIEDVLDLAKVEAGKLRVSIEPVDVTELLQDLQGTLLPLAQRQSIALSVDVDSGAGRTIMADNHRLLQVLTNFGSNAVKYNSAGGSVAIHAEPAAAGWLRFVVIDTGMGIPAERQKDAFQPFNRLGAERGTVEGTGIGLSICRSLTLLMKGRIGFKSEEGKGSCFWVEFPLAARAGG